MLDTHPHIARRGDARSDKNFTWKMGFKIPWLVALQVVETSLARLRGTFWWPSFQTRIKQNQAKKTSEKLSLSVNCT